MIATKFGMDMGGVNGDDGGRRGTATYVRTAVEASLRRLNLETIDLYYQHRVDTKVPIEDTVGEMARLKDEGKIRFIGLSEAAPETIRKAHATHRITAVQTELSLWSRDAQAEVIPTVRQLGIGYVGGRHPRQAEIVAALDAMGQMPEWQHQIEDRVVAPLVAEADARRRLRAVLANERLQVHAFEQLHREVERAVGGDAEVVEVHGVRRLQIRR